MRGDTLLIEVLVVLTETQGEHGISNLRVGPGLEWRSLTRWFVHAIDELYR